MASVVSEYLWHAKEFDWVGKKRKGSWYKCYYHRLLFCQLKFFWGRRIWRLDISFLLLVKAGLPFFSSREKALLCPSLQLRLLLESLHCNYLQMASQMEGSCLLFSWLCRLLAMKQNLCSSKVHPRNVSLMVGLKRTCNLTFCAVNGMKDQ